MTAFPQDLEKHTHIYWKFPRWWCTSEEIRSLILALYWIRVQLSHEQNITWSLICWEQMIRHALFSLWKSDAEKMSNQWKHKKLMPWLSSAFHKGDLLSDMLASCRFLTYIWRKCNEKNIEILWSSPINFVFHMPHSNSLVKKRERRRALTVRSNKKQFCW